MSLALARLTTVELTLKWAAVPLLVIGTISNAMVMVAILGDKKMRTSPMYLILANLARTRAGLIIDAIAL